MSLQYNVKWFEREVRQRVAQRFEELSIDDCMAMVERVFVRQKGLCGVTKDLLIGTTQWNCHPPIRLIKIDPSGPWSEENVQWVLSRVSSLTPKVGRQPPIKVAFNSHADMVKWCEDVLTRLGHVVSPPSGLGG